MATPTPQPQIIYQLADTEPEESNMPEVHLWDYVQVILQRLPLALLVFTGVMVIAIIYTFTRTPRYTSEARLLVEASQVNGYIVVTF